MDPFIGEVRAFSFDFAPKDWARCDGAILPITQNQAAYSLLGTRFGGNGTNTFGLPDLRGRTILGSYTGPLDYRPAVDIGTANGTETITLTAAETPAHTHTTNVVTTGGNYPIPNGNLLATVGQAGATTIDLYAPYDSFQTTTLSPVSIAPAGASQAHENMQPFAVTNFCIAMVGVYPPRQ